MYNFKRLVLLCGHYGSGKTNVALNIAYDLKACGEDVAIADLDIVNPYFRTGDSRQLLAQRGIDLIISPYAGSNVDIPALPQEMYQITQDRGKRFVLDIGGDDRGALVLGRLAPAIIEEGNYDMLFVINCYRPLTKTPAEAIEIMREIEYAGGIGFTGIVNNSNLGQITTKQDVEHSLGFAEEVSRISGLPIVFTSVSNTIYSGFSDDIKVFPLTLQEKIF